MKTARASTYDTFRISHTYAHKVDKTLLDPTIQHVEDVVIADRSKCDYQVKRLAQNETTRVDAWFKKDGTCYKHPTVPGYEGQLPRQHNLFGQSYSIQADEGLSEIEQWRTKTRLASNRLSRHYETGPKNWGDLSDASIIKSAFKMPLLMVRPECATLLRNLPVDEPPLAPPDHFPSPYFMENPSLNKTSKGGYANKVPFGYASFGKVSESTNPGGMYDFTSIYRKRLSTEWAPVSISRPDPPFLIQPSEIYHRHIGHLPNYSGHIPGSVFRYGKTYGNDTRDAKRWLRGDFST